jgi:hypothetical protein
MRWRLAKFAARKIQFSATTLMQKLPFPFITELLLPLEPAVRPMFGSHGVYVREKIVLIMRLRESHPEANGVWIATSKEHHESLRKEFPGMHSVYILSDGKNETDWQMIHVDDDDFEPQVTRLCEMILKNDPRIGRIPKVKKKRKK